VVVRVVARAAGGAEPEEAGHLLRTVVGHQSTCTRFLAVFCSGTRWKYRHGPRPSGSLAATASAKRTPPN
jgi:hypothetical protein